ncbi:MAG TPA: alkaline phosphatase family protein [Chitinophagales bacterium]|nr:alkaline phosphatase family protein [Chitinophagales bacterium]
MFARNYRSALLLIVALISVSSGCEKDQHPEYRTNCSGNSGSKKKVLFIGMDGCRSDALKAARTPAIDSLMAQGLYSFHVDRGIYTVSVPGWTTLLHGVFPEKHGCRNNSFDGCDYAAYPDLFYYIKSARPELQLFTLTHWEDFLKITTHEDFAMTYKSDREVRNAALHVLMNCHPDVLLLHFEAPDSAGHETAFHPDTSRYLAAIEMDDRFIGDILHEIEFREEQFGEEWLIIVCTDHGGEGTTHGKQDALPQTRFVFLIVSGSFLTRKEVTGSVSNTDVFPTIMQHLNISVKDEWGIDGKSWL